MTREKLRKKAEILRSEGKSYGDISRELGVAKSTLSYWFSSDSNFSVTSEKQLKHLEKARVLSALSLKKRGEKRTKEIERKVSEEFIKESSEQLTRKIALSMLYWAEGAKSKGISGMTFANTDPMLIDTFVSLLEHSYQIKRDRIKVRLHIHSYHNEDTCKKFWSNLIKINLCQFNKTYIKPRSITKKFRENFMGICFVYYPNSDIRREVLEIGKQFCRQVSLPSFNG